MEIKRKKRRGIACDMELILHNGTLSSLTLQYNKIIHCEYQMVVDVTFRSVSHSNRTKHQHICRMEGMMQQCILYGVWDNIETVVAYHVRCTYLLMFLLYVFFLFSLVVACVLVNETCCWAGCNTKTIHQWMVKHSHGYSGLNGSTISQLILISHIICDIVLASSLSRQKQRLTVHEEKKIWSE